MAYFYDIDDEEEKKKRSSASTANNTSSGSSSSSTGLFHDIDQDEPVKQQLEIREEPVKENIQPIQEVKQEPVVQPVQEDKRSVVKKARDSLYGIINSSVKKAQEFLISKGATAKPTSLMKEDELKKRVAKDTTINENFNESHVAMLGEEMLKTNAKEELDYLARKKSELEEYTQDRTVWLSKKRQEAKESGTEFNASELLKEREQKLKDIALEMKYFSKEDLKNKDLKDITITDTQAKGMFKNLERREKEAERSLMLIDEITGKVEIDKNFLNALKRTGEDREYLLSLLKGEKIELKEDFNRAMEKVYANTPFNQLESDERRAIITVFNKDSEDSIDRGFWAEAPSKIAPSIGLGQDILLSSTLFGGAGKLVTALGSTALTSLPRTVEGVMGNTEDNYSFVPIKLDSGETVFRIATVSEGAENKTLGTLTSIGASYTEMAIELLVGDAIDKGLKWAVGYASKTALAQTIGSKFAGSTVKKAYDFLVTKPSTKAFLQSIGVDSLLGNTVEEGFQDISTSVGQGQEYEISDDYMKELIASTALITFTLGVVPSVMNNVMTKDFVKEVNNDKASFGLPDNAELQIDGTVIDVETQQDITQQVQSGELQQQVTQETEELEGQTGAFDELEADIAKAEQEIGQEPQVGQETITVYRGGEGNNWVSEDKDFASEYGNVRELQLSKDANMLEVIGDSADILASEYLGENVQDSLSTTDLWYQPDEKFTQFLIDKGYDGFINEDNIYIANKSILTETTQQPKAKETPVKIEQEARKYKSAEEFVNQFEKHGGEAIEGKLIRGDADAIWSTGNDKYINQLMAIKRNGKFKTYQVYLGDKKIADLTDTSFIQELRNKVGTKYGNNKTLSEGAVNALSKKDGQWAEWTYYKDLFKDLGYDGVRVFESDGTKSTGVFADSLTANDKILTKEQLADIWNKAQPKTQKEKVKEVLEKERKPMSIKEVAEATKILEPNIRRILGVGAKTGEFERVADGVYVLKTESGQVAYIQAGNALEELPKLAKDGFKADMVFLDIPYKTPAITGGNRGMKYDFVTPAQFGDVLDSVNKILRKETSPVIYMYSQAESGLEEMQKYNDMLDKKGLKVIAKGEWQKTYKDGKPVAMFGRVAKPEGILLLSQSGRAVKDILEVDLKFDFVRPKGYQSEKNAEMIRDMIELTTETGDIVLDPFAGSGVVPAEAIKAGRSAVAIEVDKKVVEETIKPRVAKASKEVKSEYLYHGTNEDVLDIISKEGLKPMRRGELSLSKDETYAKSFAREGMTPKGKTSAVMLRVNADLLKDKILSSNKVRPKPDQLYEVLTKETIPPEALEILKDGKWVSLIPKVNKEVKVEGLTGENQKRFTYNGYEFITTEFTPSSAPSPVPLDTSKKVLNLYGQTKDGWTFVENKSGLEPFTDEQLEGFITKYKDRLIKPKTQEAEHISEATTWISDEKKLEFLNNSAQDDYGKTWDKLTPQQQLKTLMALPADNYIRTTDVEVLKKLGRGVDILSLKDTATADKQEILLWGGEREGLYTDGMILFTDKPVVKKIIDKFQEQYLTKFAQSIKKQHGTPLAEAKEGIRSTFTKERIEDFSFPETQPILDSAKANHKLTPIGFYTDGNIRQSGSIIFRAENGTLVRMSGKYYSAVKSFYPTAEFYITDESNVKPISFVVGKSRKGIVMPMVVADDTSFNNLTGTTKLTAQEQKNINNASVMNDADVKGGIKDEFFAEIVYDKKAIKDIPYREGVISYGAGKYKFDKYGITVDMADGREYSFLMSDIYDEITEQVKEEDRRSKLTKEERKKAEDDDIAFYTTARRRGQRGYDNITSMADIRRNLDILRKDRLGTNKKEYYHSTTGHKLGEILDSKVLKSESRGKTSFADNLDFSMEYGDVVFVTSQINPTKEKEGTSRYGTEYVQKGDIPLSKIDRILLKVNETEGLETAIDITPQGGKKQLMSAGQIAFNLRDMGFEVRFVVNGKEVGEGYFTASDDQLMLTSGAIQPVGQARGRELYHGTRKSFDSFDITKSNEVRTKEFGGIQAIYFSEDAEVASKYADSVQGQFFDNSIIDSIKEVNKTFGELVELFYEGKDINSYLKERGLESEVEVEKALGGFSLTNASDVSASISGTKVDYGYEGNGSFGGFWKNINALTGAKLTIEKLGLSDLIQRRIVKVLLDNDIKIKELGYIDDTSTSTASQRLTRLAMKAKKDGFDGIRYQTEQSIDNKPEIAIWSNIQQEVLQATVREEDTLLQEANLFKDSVVQKTVYHGTNSKFDKFSYEFMGTTGTADGYGFYFTDKQDVAKMYVDEKVGRLIEANIDIKKPLSEDKITITKQGLAKVFRELDPTGEMDVLSNFGDVNSIGYEKLLSMAVEQEFEYNENDVDMAHDIMNMMGRNPEKFYPVLTKVLGYDGIISEKQDTDTGEKFNVYVVFSNDQIQQKELSMLSAIEDPLITEARKYDSAEEFVKAQGTPVYHGTGEGVSFDKFDASKAQFGNRGKQIYLTENKVAADWFSKLKSQSNFMKTDEFRNGIGNGAIGDFTPNTLEFIVPKGAKIKVLDKLPQQGAETVISQLKKQGYDGVRFTDDVLNQIEGQIGLDKAFVNGKHPDTTIIFNPDILTTKSQLTDIWNQAQSETLKAKEDESKGSQSLETYEAREVTPAEQLKMSDEVKALVHKYADKVGEKYLPRGVLGVFYGKTKEIRLKGITDLYVASHEISHAIDKKYEITARITPRDSVDMQLREAYINLYPTAKETHAVKTQKLEGFAMAVATYIQRPSSFAQEYPVIVKEMFTQGGKYYNTEIGEYLNDVSNIVSRYQSLNDLDRVATRISKDIPVVEQTLFKSKTEATVNMLQNDLNLFERWVKENGDTMTKADFTNLFRFRTQVKQIYENNIATNLSKKNVEEGKFKNFMGGLYSYIRKSVAQDVYMVYNPETKNIERKYDFNWGTLRREIAQKGMDRQFNSLLVARRAYYDFEYADKLRGEIETIKADLESLQDEVIAMYQKKEGDRDKRAEKALEAEIEGTKVLLQEVESNLEEVESLLKNDGWDRRLVTDSYLNNQGLFEKELDMFDKLVGQDILLAKQVGIISNDKYNELKDNKGYAPFKRIIYDEVLGEVDPSEISGNLKLGSREISSLKKRTGSTKEIIYPLQSAMRNHMEFLNKSVSQDAINTFLTERTMEMHSANIKQVEWHKGIENQKDIIIRMENGVRKAYAVDPMIKELIAGYLSPRQVDLLERVQQGYKQLFTIGTTGTYFQFVFTNIPRDAFNYITQTYQSSSIKAVYNLFADTAKVILGNNADNNLELQYFQKYLALGGREMTFVKYMEGDYDAFTTFLRHEEKGLKKVLNTLGKGVKVGLDVLSMPSQLSEMWYRSVEFIEAKKSGDSDVVALEKARRVTTPFHFKGSFKFKDSKGNIVKAPPIPKYAPFQNASLQAFAWAGGNFVKDPKIRSRMIFMIALTTALGLEELLRAWSNADDDDKEQFKDLSAEDLSRFIHMPKKGGGIRRIAVSEWAGSIAGTINMAVMDFILEDDADYNVTDYATALTTSVPDQFNLLTPVIKLLEKGTWDEFGKWGTSLLPALANPIIAIMGYKTYPEFAPLESDWQKRKLPADRYNEGTSKFAKWAMSLELPFDKGRLGDNLNLSPLQLDAILTQSFGRTIGMITGKPDAWNVLKSVNREYYFEYGRRLNDYWDTKEKNDQLYDSMTKGTRSYSKEKELEVFRRKTISKDIDTALDEYRTAYDSKDIAEIEATRARVIDLVTRYNENPSTPEMEIYLSNPNAKTMEEAMRSRALREISMKDPRDYTKDELADAKALAKEFRQEALLARSDYSYSELMFGITKNDDKVTKIEEVINSKDMKEAELKKYLASLKYAGMISNDVIVKLYNTGVIDYNMGKWANDLESNRNF